MSIQTMNAVWRYSKATGRTKLTLLAIADHQGEQGAWPALGTLAKMVGASERSVMRDIEQLENLGELKVKRYGSPTNSRNKTNLYFVTLYDVTDSHLPNNDVTESADDVTNQADDVTLPVIQTLNRNLNKNLKGERYQPTEEFIKELEAKFYGIDVRNSYEAFMDWVDAKGAKYKNWDAAFRNWVRKEFNWSDTNKQQKNREETRKFLDRDTELTKKMISEWEDQAKNAVAPPKCPHGNSVVSCRECLKA